MDSSAFSYAVGRVRALEAKQLAPGDVERMLGAKDAYDAYRIFNDIEFSTHIGAANEIHDFQKVIDAELADTKKLLTSIVHPDLVWVLEILWIRYDFHNLKTALKGNILNWSAEETKGMMMDELGAISTEHMYDFVTGGSVGDLIDERYILAKEKAEKAYEESKDIRSVEYVLDRDLHTLKYHLAKKSKNKFLLDFVQKEIDAYNIITYFRLKGEISEFEVGFEDLFVDNGKVSYEKFFNDKEKTIEGLLRTDYYRMAKAYELYNKNEVDFAALEREGDNMLVEHMQQTKHTPLGPEPIFAYYWAKKNNARVIRMVMVGKLAGLSEDSIRKRLRKLYAD